MTAFGSSRLSSATGDYFCEIRCVNHRYLDVHFRLPEELRAFESEFHGLITKSIGRGRVDCAVRRDEHLGVLNESEINEKALKNLLELANNVGNFDSSITKLSTSEVLRWPGVIQAKEVDANELKKDAMQAVKECLENTMEARKTEGHKLHQLIENRIKDMNSIVADIRERMPEIQQLYRTRLEEKLQAVKENLDESRLEQEMVIFLNKTDVMEELDRLNVHFAEVTKTLGIAKPKGRRLDFLMQELNREANTLGSKSQDAKLTQQSVDLKVLIEQMREQVQNIE